MIIRLLLVGFLGGSQAFAGLTEFSARQLKDPIRTEAFWRKSHETGKKLRARIAPAPVELVSYLARENKHYELAEVPKTGNADGELVNDLRKAIETLPDVVSKIAERDVAGVFLVKDLGSTAFTDFIHDEKGVETRVLIVLDEGKLNRKANEWATWKENTPFMASAGAFLRATIEDPANDNRVQALQYIFLHELGHAVGWEKRLHAYWGNVAEGESHPSRFPFSSLSWTANEEYLESIYEQQFPARQLIRYYSQSDYSVLAAPAVYEALKKTNFPTLYAAIHPADDFAESFASFVHVVLQGKPWSIVVKGGPGLPETKFVACWKEERCAKKKAIIEATLKSYEEPVLRRPASD